MGYNIPKISESEYVIMKIIWDNNPVKAHEIVNIAKKSCSWSENTIRTLINRLLNKSAINFVKDGKSYNYYPLIKEIDYRKHENKSFLNRIYRGSIDKMVLNFIKDIELSQEELDSMIKMLDKNDDND